MLKIKLCITWIDYILKYKLVTLNVNDISQYYCFYCIFDQIIAALLNMKDIQNIQKLFT